MDRMSRYFKLVDEMPDYFNLEKHGEHIVIDQKVIAMVEKKLGKPIGVLYEDEHIILVVDLVCDEHTNKYRTKGRIIHRHGGATVIVPITEGKDFILLKQFRHATQRGQLSFPRSFEYDGSSGKEHAKKLSRELLHTECTDMKFLGELTVESDLVGMKVAVYLMLVDDYRIHLGDITGIIDMTVMSRYQLESAIRRFEIDDSITIAAFELWKSHLMAQHDVAPENTF